MFIRLATERGSSLQVGWLGRGNVIMKRCLFYSAKSAGYKLGQTRKRLICKINTHCFLVRSAFLARTIVFKDGVIKMSVNGQWLWFSW